jgi:hypothetical protein
VPQPPGQCSLPLFGDRRGVEDIVTGGQLIGDDDALDRGRAAVVDDDLDRQWRAGLDGVGHLLGDDYGGLRAGRRLSEQGGSEHDPRANG